MDQAIQVAGFAGSQRTPRNPNPGMAEGDFCFLVSVASVTGVGGIRGRVAGLAGDLAAGDPMV